MSKNTISMIVLCFSVAFCVLPTFLVLGQSVSRQTARESLQFGTTVKKQIAGGEIHSYQVGLTAGQYLKITARQRGIDVVLRVIAPNDEKLLEMDTLNGTQGPEIAAIIAAQPGDFRVELVANRNVPPGSYELTVEPLRPKSERDQKWIEAQEAYLKGVQLRGQSSGEAQRKAIAEFENAVALWRALDDKLMEAHTLYYIASGYRSVGQPRNALDRYNQALKLVDALGEEGEAATTLVNVGITKGELGESRTALTDFEKALSVWRKMGDVYGESRTLSNFGLAFALLGDSQKALQTYREALERWQKLNNVRQQADTINNIAGVYESSGYFQLALQHYREAISLRRALKDRAGEASSLNSIGGIYWALGEPDKALDYHLQALSIFQTLGDRRRESISLTNIGLDYASLRNPEKALDNYNKALPLQRELGIRTWEAITLLRMGELYAAGTDAHKAFDYYEQALKIRQATEDKWGQARVLIAMGSLQTQHGVADKAVELNKDALALYRSVGDRSGEARALYGLARADSKRGNPKEARKHIEAALILTEDSRSQFNSVQLRQSYFATTHDYYEHHIDVLMQLHKAEPTAGFNALALEASERARARGLLEMLVEARVDIERGVEPSLLERERGLATRLNAKGQRRLQLFAQRGAEAQIAAINQELNELEANYQQVQAEIRKNSPSYAALTQPQPLHMDAMQEQLDANTVLLQYSLGSERSYLWLVSTDSLQSYELPSRAQVEKSARRLYELLIARGVRNNLDTPAQRQQRVAEADLELAQANKELSQMIIAPVADRLATKKLIIVADGALQYIPFAALSEPGIAQATKRVGQIAKHGYSPLILHHEVVNIPSASSLAVHRVSLANRKPAPKAVAVLADPVFSANDPRMSKANSELKREATPTNGETRLIQHLADNSTGTLSIRRLPFTRQEANQILAVAQRSGNLEALDFRANRETATGGALSTYRYVHFATHGYVDTERPDLSAIVLSLVDENGKAQDGFLRAHEIYNLRLPAELVVLSACETGLGKEYRGEGLTGLTRGFMYAGAKRVTVSLWNVNDKATADLMARFYRGMLRENKTPAAALRMAQLEMLRVPQWRSPYYWAAFVMQGEWR
jgi:CHAT domain-containing protein